MELEKELCFLYSWNCSSGILPKLESRAFCLWYICSHAVRNIVVIKNKDQPQLTSMCCLVNIKKHFLVSY